MSQLGKAYIEVIGDLKKFPADLRAKLKKALAEGISGVEFTGLETKAAEAGTAAADAAAEGFERRGRHRLRRAGEDGGRSLLGGLRRIFSRDSGESRGFLSSLTGFFGTIVSGIGDAVKTGASGLGSAGSGIASALGSVGSSIASVGGGAGGVLQIAAFAVLIPIIIQLAGALVQVGAALFALPAAAGVALGAILPLVIAFQGFGEAVGAGLAGDTEKFNEALKGLAPSARAVVKEFVALNPQFKAIKASVQQAFFEPLRGFFTEFGQTLLPLAGRGLTQIGGSLGRLARALGGVFTSPENLRTFNALFASTDRIVKTLEPTLVSLAQAMLNLIGPALPFLERGARAFKSFAADVESFTRRIAGNGQLADWLDKAARALGGIVGLAKDLGAVLIETLGGEIGDIGVGFIEDFRVKLQEFLAFLRSPDGQEAIHNLGVLLKFVGDVFLFLLNLQPAIMLFFNGVFDVVRLVGRGLQALGGWVVDAGKAIGSFFVGAWNWIKGAGSAIGNFFTETIPSWWDSVVGFFTSLPDRVVSALQGFRDAGRNFIVDTLTEWYEQVFQWVGNIIGIFLSLPVLIPAALEVLQQKFNELWTAIWQGAIDLFWWGVNSTIAVIYAIPGLAEDAGRAVWTFFTGLWTNVVNSVQATVETGFTRVMDFIGGLPGRVRALGPALYNAAVSLGHRIGDGLANIGTFASDVGRRIVNTIKSGINFVIGSINSGIAEIDDRLPGSLPRIPMFARGAVVDSPTLALVGEAGPEVVVPLGDRKRAQELAEQSGLLSMLRGAPGGTNVTVIAYLDPSGVIIPITKTIVTDTFDQQGDELSYARPA